MTNWLTSPQDSTFIAILAVVVVVLIVERIRT